MDEKFFDTGFLFERYLTDRLLEISDEGERVALKEVMKATLLPFYKHTEEAYLELKERLAKEQDGNHRYEIITGVEKRSRIDLTEDIMVPMQAEDMQKFLVDIAKMQEALERQQTYTVMKVFLAMNYKEICRLEREQRVFKALIHTENGEYPAEVFLKRNTSYQKQLAELYQIFEENGLEWRTICAPYLGKYFDVQIKKATCPEDDIVEISVDFEEYAEKIVYDLVPMWNVRYIEERTSAYPDFALDRIHYEHCIYKNRFQEKRDYLVQAEGIKLWEVFWQNGDMHIVCDRDQPMKWKLLEIGYDAWKQTYDMPIFGNLQKEKAGQRCIHTYAEIKKYVKELGYEKSLQLMNVKMMEQAPVLKNTYSMDGFLEDEIRVSDKRSCLIFTFRPADKENYLNYDIMSYLVSRIQWEFPEFECIGELE